MTIDTQAAYDLLARQVDWLRHERHVRGEMSAVLAQMQDGVSALVRDLPAVSRRDINTLSDEIGGLLRGSFDALADVLNPLPFVLAEHEWLVWWLGGVAAAYALRGAVSGLPETVLRDVARGIKAGGRTLAQSLSKQRKRLFSRLRSAIRAADGQPPELDGVFGRMKRDAATLSRTWFAAAGAAVREAFARVNPLVRGWRHLSVLDGKTSGVCLHRQGLMWNKHKEPVGHDVPFARPPLHPNCRSSLVFAFDLDAPFEGITGADWVQSRSAAQLRGQFGATLGQMLHDGVITLPDAVSADGLKPLTLAQLRAKTRFSFVGRRQEYELGGRVLSRWELAELSGAADGSEIAISEQPPSAVYSVPFLRLIIQNKGVYEYAMQRALLDEKDGLALVNEAQFLRREQQGKGIATEALKQQIRAARHLGVKEIRTFAVRGDGANGYYTWPRLGFDGDLPEIVRNKLPDDLRDAARVSDLMRSVRGREWWKRHGISIELVFDLRGNSRSIRMLKQYLSDNKDKS